MIVKSFIVVDVNIAAVVVRIYREVIPDRLGDLIENCIDPSPKFNTYDFACFTILGLTIGDILEQPSGRFLMRFLCRCRMGDFGLVFGIQQSLLACQLSCLFDTGFTVKSGINLKRITDVQPNSERSAVQASLPTLRRWYCRMRILPYQLPVAA